jgi:hypothetical protein
MATKYLAAALIGLLITHELDFKIDAGNDIQWGFDIPRIVFSAELILSVSCFMNPI